MQTTVLARPDHGIFFYFKGDWPGGKMARISWTECLEVELWTVFFFDWSGGKMFSGL